MTRWYVWLLGRFVNVDGQPSWAIVGIYSSRERARAAGQPGDGIVIFALDDTAQDQYRMQPEWIR